MDDPTPWELLRPFAARLDPRPDPERLELHLACDLIEHGSNPQTLAEPPQSVTVLRSIVLTPAVARILAGALLDGKHFETSSLDPPDNNP